MQASTSQFYVRHLILFGIVWLCTHSDRVHAESRFSSQPSIVSLFTFQVIKAETNQLDRNQQNVDHSQLTGSVSRNIIVFISLQPLFFLVAVARHSPVPIYRLFPTGLSPPNASLV